LANLFAQHPQFSGQAASRHGLSFAFSQTVLSFARLCALTSTAHRSLSVL
jgi:hypothetical protein